MTQIASPLQRGKYAPFLPNNFYEAQQYAAYRPAAVLDLSAPSTTISAELIATTESTATTYTRQTRPVGRRAEWERQARTKEIHGWLNNLHLLLENYIDSDGRVASITHSQSWAAHQVAVTRQFAPNTEKKPRGRPKKVVRNRLKPYLRNFMFARDALQALSGFDDIVHGAVRLDAGGNTRPLSKTMMVSLLLVLDEITAEAVQEDIDCSLRHAQRIAMCLRVIELAAYKVAQKHWYAATETDWSDLD